MLLRAVWELEASMPNPDFDCMAGSGVGFLVSRAAPEAIRDLFLRCRGYCATSRRLSQRRSALRVLGALRFSGSGTRLYWGLGRSAEETLKSYICV